MANIKYFKKVSSNFNGNITLSANQFRLLALIDENKPIGSIAAELGMDTADFKKHLKQLYKMGLIIPVVKKTIQRYSPEFLQEIKSILAYHVGPVANIIMTDILSDMNITDQRIPVDDLWNLISRITDEISDLGQKFEFRNKVEKLLLQTR